MTASEILLEVNRLGVALRLDGANIRITNASRLTGELRVGIREHKAQLVRDLLLRDALAYLGERVGGQLIPEGLAPFEAQVNEAYFDEDLEEFRAAIREYVRAALRAFRAREERAA